MPSIKVLLQPPEAPTFHSFTCSLPKLADQPPYQPDLPGPAPAPAGKPAIATLAQENKVAAQVSPAQPKSAQPSPARWGNFTEHGGQFTERDCHSLRAGQQAAGWDRPARRVPPERRLSALDSEGGIQERDVFGSEKLGSVEFSQMMIRSLGGRLHT
jgi:hypothetical protein